MISHLIVFHFIRKSLNCQKLLRKEIPLQQGSLTSFQRGNVQSWLIDGHYPTRKTFFSSHSSLIISMYLNLIMIIGIMNEN